MSQSQVHLDEAAIQAAVIQQLVERYARDPSLRRDVIEKIAGWGPRLHLQEHPMTHRIPLGTRLLLTLPFTPELLDGDECEPFCPGITGTVECWVIGHTPSDGEPEYTICPYKNRQIGGQPMWEFLAEVDSHFMRRVPPRGMDYHQWASMAILELSTHRIARRIPERLLLPFVQKD